LARLCIYLRDLAPAADETLLEGLGPAGAAQLPKAYRRALEMLEALRDFGFVSFFK